MCNFDVCRGVQGCGTIRAASHYGRRSRGRRFPPIGLQETKSSASRPFTLEAKVQRPSPSKMPTWQHFLTKATASRKEVWVGREWKPKLWSRGRRFLFIKNENYILLPIFSRFLWTLNKVWPLNPTASRLGRP